MILITLGQVLNLSHFGSDYPTAKITKIVVNAGLLNINQGFFGNTKQQYCCNFLRDLKYPTNHIVPKNQKTFIHRDGQVLIVIKDVSGVVLRIH